MKFERRGSAWPSSNYGWRLGVSTGAAILLILILLAHLLLLEGLWNATR